MGVSDKSKKKSEEIIRAVRKSQHVVPTKKGLKLIAQIVEGNNYTYKITKDKVEILYGVQGIVTNELIEELQQVLSIKRNYFKW